MDPKDRLFGEIAVRLQLLSREQVASCIHEQASEGGGRRIGEVALQQGLLSREEVEVVLRHQAQVLDRRRGAGRAPAGGVVEEQVRAKEPTVDRPARTPNAGAGIAAKVDRPKRPGPQAASARSEEATASPPLKPRVNSLEFGATMAAMDAAPPVAAASKPAVTESKRTVVGMPPDPATQSALAETLPDPALRGSEARSNAAQNAPRAAPARAETQPIIAANGGGLAADDYDFGAPPAAPGPAAAPARGTLVDAAGRAETKHSPVSTGTLVQPFATPARRVPLDRAWRNPSKPPPAAPLPQAFEAPAAAPAPQIEPSGPRTGTPAWAPTPAAVAARARPFVQKPAPASTDGAYLDRVLKLSLEAGASDLHCHSGAPLLARVDGALWPLSGDAPLPPSAAERVIAEIMTDAQWADLTRDGDVRFAYRARGLGCFRAHAFRQEQGLDITFRILPEAAPSLEDLGLPARLGKLFSARRGLGLCTGPLGSGKTTTLSALVRALVENGARHVIAIEDPIELPRSAGGAMIEVLEVPTHATSLAAGIELAVRCGPDAIVVSDLADPATVAAALAAAQAGCRVLGCLAASSATSALARLLGGCSADARETMREELADVLQVVINQRLLPQAIGHGRVPAVEILVATSQVCHLIREDKPQQISGAIASGKPAGMQSLDDSLDELVTTGAITAEQARKVAQKKDRWKAS